MSAHFATRILRPDGGAEDLTEAPWTSADLSPTGSQMPRLVGLAWASKLYREIPGLEAAAPGLLARRLGGRLGDDRQRLLRRGHVLGGDQRRRRPRVARC